MLSLPWAYRAFRRLSGKKGETEALGSYCEITSKHDAPNDPHRSGGPAMHLIGLQDSRIEANIIDSPIRATLRARPTDETDRQAILLRHSTRVTL